MDDPSKFPDIKTYDDCARQVYENTKLSGRPGHTYTYNSVHLQLAGAVALAAAGETSIQTIVKKYLLDPYGMTSTTCANPTAEIPQIAVCMETVGADYGRFLQAQLSHSVLPVRE